MDVAWYHANRYTETDPPWNTNILPPAHAQMKRSMKHDAIRYSAAQCTSIAKTL